MNLIKIRFKIVKLFLNRIKTDFQELGIFFLILTTNNYHIFLL